MEIIIETVVWFVAGLVVFGVAAPVGYCLPARLMRSTSVSFFFFRATDLETKWRDRLFLPLTRRMTKISPNAVTTVGFVITGVLAYWFWVGAPLSLIFAGILVGGLTDMLDGPLARNNDKVSSLGAKLDWWRDLALTVVIGGGLTYYGVLSPLILGAFLSGWAILGLLRAKEFKAEGGTAFTGAADHKFILDRVRLVVIWVAVMFLLLAPLQSGFGTVGTVLAWLAIVASWFSVALHGAHVRMLRKEGKR